jgi:hypothetical protein
MLKEVRRIGKISEFSMSKRKRKRKNLGTRMPNEVLYKVFWLFLGEFCSRIYGLG